ncbi:hypothetical protein [Streptosporangium sp. NPDC051022]|uniref:hypothetical protein n=1 Tax=Streptosporangium sp. NPDC051022 TaxID=3155752 RepID=UPI00343C7598
MSQRSGEGAVAGQRNRRRPRTGQPIRPHRVGPLRLSDLEPAALTLAAERRTLSVGAYVSDVALSVAHETLNPLPADWRAQLNAFADARAAIANVAASLRRLPAESEPGDRDAVRLQQMLTDAQRTVMRMEDVCEVILRENKVPTLESRRRRQRRAAQRAAAAATHGSGAPEAEEFETELEDEPEAEVEDRYEP